MVEVLEFVATNFARNIQMDKLTSNALVPLDTYPSSTRKKAGFASQFARPLRGGALASLGVAPSSKPPELL